MFSEAHNVWRKHPWLRQKENLKVMFPGFGTAVVIFGTYMFVEEFYKRFTARKALSAAAVASAPPSSEISVDGEPIKGE